MTAPAADPVGAFEEDWVLIRTQARHCPECAAKFTPRLVAALEAVLALADEWASAVRENWWGMNEAADDIREAIEAALRDAQDPAAAPSRGTSIDPTPDCGGPRKPPDATEAWWCGDHREFHGSPDERDAQETE